jgi:hypothetical protein
MIAQTSVEIIDEKAKKKRGAKIKVQLFSGFKEAAERYEAVGDWTRAAEARRRVFEQAQTLRKLGNTNNFARLAAARGRLDTGLSRVGNLRRLLDMAWKQNMASANLPSASPMPIGASGQDRSTTWPAASATLGRFGEAIEKARVAEQIWRELAERQPDAYRADWAWALAVFAESSLNSGDFSESIAYSRHSNR